MVSSSELALPYESARVIEFELLDPEAGTPGIISPVGGTVVSRFHLTKLN